MIGLQLLRAHIHRDEIVTISDPDNSDCDECLIDGI